jgi:hypothetical protein
VAEASPAAATAAGGRESRPPLPGFGGLHGGERPCLRGGAVCGQMRLRAAAVLLRPAVAVSFGSRVVLASALAVSTALVGAGGVGGRPLLAMAGLRRPASATTGLGWPRLAAVAGDFLVLSSSLLVWRCRGGGVSGLAGTCWWCCGGAFSCARSRPVEVLRRCRGAADCFGHVRAAGMVRNQAKASTDTC